MCPQDFPAGYFWYGGKRRGPGRPPKLVDRLLSKGAAASGTRREDSIDINDPKDHSQTSDPAMSMLPGNQSTADVGKGSNGSDPELPIDQAEDSDQSLQDNEDLSDEDGQPVAKEDEQEDNLQSVDIPYNREPGEDTIGPDYTASADLQSETTEDPDESESSSNNPTESRDHATEYPVRPISRYNGQRLQRQECMAPMRHQRLRREVKPPDRLM